MTLKLYMDHNVPATITAGLRIRGVDVVTAYEDEHHMVDDARLLDRATAMGRVLFTRDDDLIAEAVVRQREGREFAGVIYAHQLKITIGAAIFDLLLIANAGDPPELRNTIQFLPL